MENNYVEKYGGKIMKSVFDNYTKDELQDILNRSHSFSEVLSYVGLSSNSGSGNYKTLHKIIDEYKLDVSKLNKNRKNNKNYSNHSNQEKSVYEYLINGITCSSYKLKNKLNKLLSNQTGKDIKTIEQDTERDHFLSADEALEYGLIDKVL